MNVVLLRVGVDSGSGGIQGPLFDDGSFEFIPIPDGSGVGLRTYGNTLGIKGLPYSAYFPTSRWNTVESLAMHVDPEFESFTYGDPTPPKAGLRRLHVNDRRYGAKPGSAYWSHLRIGVKEPADDRRNGATSGSP